MKKNATEIAQPENYVQPGPATGSFPATSPQAVIKPFFLFRFCCSFREVMPCRSVHIPRSRFQQQVMRNSMNVAAKVEVSFQTSEEDLTHAEEAGSTVRKNMRDS